MDTSVNFYRQEVTIGFNEHYIHAKKDDLTMQVYSINCGARNYSTAQYALKIFKKCADDLLPKNICYKVKLGYVDNGYYTYTSASESDVHLAPSAVKKIWHGELNLSKSDPTWKKQVNEHYQFMFTADGHLYLQPHTHWDVIHFCP